jgi:hypothetical protein
VASSTVINVPLWEGMLVTEETICVWVQEVYEKKLYLQPDFALKLELLFKKKKKKGQLLKSQFSPSGF